MFCFPKTCVFLILLFKCVMPKYMEGHIKTSDDWAFLARFCFLSEQGTFEYYFHFNAEQGFPNLLLYYDADSQWPAVYKSSKTCREKEAVLNIEQNQIVNLSIQYPYSELSGCTYHVLNEDSTQYTTPKKSTARPTKAPTYTVNVNGHVKTTKSMSQASTTTFATTTTTTTTSVPITTEHFMTTSKLNEFNNSDIFEIDNIENLFGEDIDNFTVTHLESEYKISTKAPIKKRAVVPNPSKNWKNVVVTCRNARRFRSARERWWFIAISNCDGYKGIDLNYQILMTNGPPGDYWHEHFSADEFYILPVLMAFSTAYGFLLFAIVMCSVELKSRQLLHSTYKLYVLSVLCQFLGVALQTICYLKYAAVGIMPYKVKTIGGVFMGTSETLFLLVLLLLAKGYTTTRGRLPLSASIKLTVFMNLYSITYVTIFIYEAKVFDPGQVLYLYESPAGYALIVLRIVAWWMFIYSTVFTLKHYPEKSNFYYPFNICGTLWFVAGPAFILSANSYIDKWVRESVVCGVLLFISFAGHLMFLVLTLPAMANKNFPFHIRTTQIGVMEVVGNAGDSTMDHFSHHPYQPSTHPETVIIPLNPNTDEWNSPRRVPQQQTAKEQSESEDEHNSEINKDSINMENVLSWSLAKGVPPPIIESIRTPEIPAEPITLSPNSIFRQANLTETNNLSEWTREVPVELFTISRLVVDKKSSS